MAVRRPDDRRSHAPLEGHLDLDALDADEDLLDLDVIGDDGPGIGERLTDWWRGSAAGAFVARHRAAAVALGVVVALVVASGAAWWVRRPAPLGDPRVVARAAGTDPTAALVTDSNGVYARVQQQLLVRSAEAPGVAVRLLGLAGPGLSVAVPGDKQSYADVTQDPVLLSGAVTCATPEATTSALSSGPADYVLVVQRTVDEGGETRVDRVPFAGSDTLAQLVHQACLQRALDRDVVVRGITAEPVPDVAALRLAIDLYNASPRSWSGLQVAATAEPLVTNDAREVALEPGEAATVHAVLWPADCADPVGSLRAGLAVEADLGPSGRPPSESPAPPRVLLRLPGAMLDVVAAVAARTCGTTPPRGTVTWARLREGGSNGSGGVVDLGLSFTAPGAGIVEVDHAGDGSAAQGELFAYETPVRAVDGVATVKAQWRLPGCAVILRDGLPRVHVVVGDGVRRPYLLPLAGEPLRPVLARLCGSEVADLLR